MDSEALAAETLASSLRLPPSWTMSCLSDVTTPAKPLSVQLTPQCLRNPQRKSCTSYIWLNVLPSLMWSSQLKQGLLHPHPSLHQTCCPHPPLPTPSVTQWLSALVTIVPLHDPTSLWSIHPCSSYHWLLFSTSILLHYHLVESAVGKVGRGLELFFSSTILPEFPEIPSPSLPFTPLEEI